jgi:hypothetical protein
LISSVHMVIYCRDYIQIRIDIRRGPR